MCVHLNTAQQKILLLYLTVWPHQKTYQDILTYFKIPKCKLLFLLEDCNGVFDTSLFKNIYQQHLYQSYHKWYGKLWANFSLNYIFRWILKLYLGYTMKERHIVKMSKSDVHNSFHYNQQLYAIQWIPKKSLYLSFLDYFYSFCELNAIIVYQNNN